MQNNPLAGCFAFIGFCIS